MATNTSAFLNFNIDGAARRKRAMRLARGFEINSSLPKNIGESSANWAVISSQIANHNKGGEDIR